MLPRYTIAVLDLVLQRRCQFYSGDAWELLAELTDKACATNIVNAIGPTRIVETTHTLNNQSR